MSRIAVGLAVLRPRTTGTGVVALHVGHVAELLDVVAVTRGVVTCIEVVRAKARCIGGNGSAKS